VGAHTKDDPLAQVARFYGMSELLVYRLLKALGSLSPEDQEFQLWRMQRQDKCWEREKLATLSAEDRSFLDDCDVVSDTTRSKDERVDAYERLKVRWREATTDRKGLSLIRGGRHGSAAS
jgi:Zn-dependent peptidase ImmA (M78 family)